MVEGDLHLKSKKVSIKLAGFEGAQTVSVIGEFNNWNDSTGQMEKTKKGWEKQLELLPGAYEYKFLINQNKYITDPKNTDSTYVSEVRSYNSVLTIKE